MGRIRKGKGILPEDVPELFSENGSKDEKTTKPKTK
jgi:hypothetical protein